MYQPDCGTAHPMLPNRLSIVNTSCSLALQIFIYQWGAEGCGVQHIFMSDWRALITPQMPPWTACVHFPDSYPVDVSHLSFNFSVCCYSSVSISVVVILYIVHLVNIHVCTQSSLIHCCTPRALDNSFFITAQIFDYASLNCSYCRLISLMLSNILLKKYVS